MLLWCLYQANQPKRAIVPFFTALLAAFLITGCANARMESRTASSSTATLLMRQHQLEYRLEETRGEQGNDEAADDRDRVLNEHEAIERELARRGVYPHIPAGNNAGNLAQNAQQ
jgi:hypothetical protein